MERLDVEGSFYLSDSFLKTSLLERAYRGGKKPASRCLLGCLGLLCLLLVAGLIGVVILYEQTVAARRNNDSSSEIQLKGHPPEANCNQSCQLPQSARLQREYEALQDRYSALAESKHQLMSDHSLLQRQNSQLQTHLEALRAGRAAMESNYSSLRRDKDRLQSGYDSLRHQRERLLASNRNLTALLYESKSRFRSLRTEHEQLLRNCSALKDPLAFRTSLDLAEPVPEVLLADEKLKTNDRSLQTEIQRLKMDYDDALRDLQKELDKMAIKVRGMSCQAGWRKFNTSCYFISTSRRNWMESRRDCLAKGGDLVVIDSEEEQMFVSTLLDVSQNSWIGLTDSTTEGAWIWVDGSPVTAEFWQPGQPNDWKADQDCGEITRSSSDGRGEWNDDGCFAEQLWICEK
ncbi:uncharacterized protein ACB057_010466 [Neosynchiropus ocellatus]